MRKTLSIIAISLFIAISAFAQEAPVITVSGSAEVFVVPDEVIFELDIVKANPKMELAKQQSDQVVARVLELTKRFGVDPRNVKTDQISVDSVYEVVNNGKVRTTTSDDDDDGLVGVRRFKEFRISTTVIVKLIDLTRFEEFFAESLKTGISQVDKVNFQTSKLRENKDKARDMAMKAAREKATAMAGAIGQTIGKAIKITEGSASGRYSNYSNANTFVLDGASTSTTNVATFAPGSIKVEAEVTVNFLLN